MKSIPRIGEGEWEVMEVLWKQHPLTALEIVKALKPHHPWKDPTIRSMLGRLVQKGAVSYEADGKIYYYTPLVTRDQCVHQVSETFLERVFSGAAGPLVLHFVKSKGLSQTELAELEQYLKQQKKEKLK